jgi:hypothetical protein
MDDKLNKEVNVLSNKIVVFPKSSFKLDLNRIKSNNRFERLIRIYKMVCVPNKLLFIIGFNKELNYINNFKYY